MSSFIEVNHMAVSLGNKPGGEEQIALFVCGEDNNVSECVRNSSGKLVQTWVPRWMEVIRGPECEVMGEVCKRAASVCGGGMKVNHKTIGPVDYIRRWEKAIVLRTPVGRVDIGEIVFVLCSKLTPEGNVL